MRDIHQEQLEQLQQRLADVERRLERLETRRRRPWALLPPTRWRPAVYLAQILTAGYGLLAFIIAGYYDSAPGWSVVWLILGAACIAVSRRPWNTAGIASGVLMVLFAVFEVVWSTTFTSRGDDAAFAVAWCYFFGGSALAVEAVVRNREEHEPANDRGWQFHLPVLFKLMLLAAIYSAFIGAFEVAGALLGIPICYVLALMARRKIRLIAALLFIGGFAALMVYIVQRNPHPDAFIMVINWAVFGYLLLAGLVWWESVTDGRQAHAHP